MNKKLKIAVIQAAYSGYDVESNKTKGIQLVRKAKDMGADLVLFPECWLHGYRFPLVAEGVTAEEQQELEHCPCDWDALRKNSSYKEWAEGALDEESEPIREFCRLARSLSVGIVMTCYTKGRERPRNSAFLIDKSGAVKMIYSKVHTCSFSVESMLENGEEFKVCEFEGVRIGIMICYDREYPESARILMLKGAEIILVPNSCGGMKPRVNALSTRAYENMTGVVMANVAGKDCGRSCAFTPVAWDKEGKEQEMTMFLADEESEGIYMAEYDINELRAYRSSEMMGNTFRRTEAYADLLKAAVQEPFIRDRWIE